MKRWSNSNSLLQQAVSVLLYENGATKSVSIQYMHASLKACIANMRHVNHFACMQACIPFSFDIWCAYACMYIYLVTYMELHSTEGKGDRGKRTSDRARTTLYCEVSATRAMETSRDPSSPIALMYRLHVCRYPATLKTCALRLVLCAM